MALDGDVLAIGARRADGPDDGASLALADGILAVGAPTDDSSAQNLDGDANDAPARGSGAFYLFE